jgi:hypothetical protein
MRLSILLCAQKFLDWVQMLNSSRAQEAQIKVLETFSVCGKHGEKTPTIQGKHAPTILFLRINCSVENLCEHAFPTLNIRAENSRVYAAL